MKRKAIVKNRSELASLLNKFDGLHNGISRADVRKTLKFMEVLETALILKGYKSATLIIRRNAKRKAAKIKAKS